MMSRAAFDSSEHLPVRNRVARARTSRLVRSSIRGWGVVCSLWQAAIPSAEARQVFPPPVAEMINRLVGLPASRVRRTASS